MAGDKPERAGLLNVLAQHPGVHRLLNRTLTGDVGKVGVTALCYAMSMRYRHTETERLRALLGRITAVRNFSENTSVNIFNEMQQWSPGDDKLAWIAQGFGRLSIRQRAHLLRRLFYNLVLRSLNRKIIRLRYGSRADYVPNLSTLLLAPVDRCNLRCEGCVTASDRSASETPSLERLDSIVEQAKQLNVFHIVVIGKGEPFYNREDKHKLFALAKRHDDLNFVIFTNGTTLQERDVVTMQRLENVYPIVSIDGLKEVNDARRGPGVYERAMHSMRLMNRHGLIFGYCATALRSNYRHVLSSEFVRTMADAGCKFGIYLRFLPLAEGASTEMLLTVQDEGEFEQLSEKVKKEVVIPLLDLDGLERWHGCRARRGSVLYVDGVTGKVAPCAKTPYAPPECNLYVNPHPHRPLEILRTDFFACYRASYDPHHQCSRNFAQEIGGYLQISNMSLEEKEKLRGVQEKLEGEEHGFIG